jgi:hypothetical protein
MSIALEARIFAMNPNSFDFGILRSGKLLNLPKHLWRISDKNIKTIIYLNCKDKILS